MWFRALCATKENCGGRSITETLFNKLRAEARWWTDHQTTVEVAVGGYQGTLFTDKAHTLTDNAFLGELVYDSKVVIPFEVSP